MILSLHVERLRTPEQVRACLEGSEPVDFNPVSRDEAYAFVSRTLKRFDYARLGKTDWGLVKGFLGKATGLSRARMRILVKRILRKHGYPPDLQDAAVQTVLQQAEVLSARWAA